MPTRQPVVLDLWPVKPGDSAAPFTSVMNWTAYGEHEHQGRRYGQKDREFEPYFTLPSQAGVPMELAVNARGSIRQRLLQGDGGWRVHARLP